MRALTSSLRLVFSLVAAAAARTATLFLLRLPATGLATGAAARAALELKTACMILLGALGKAPGAAAS